MVSSPLNYFQLFDIEETFSIDLASLSERYQTLQKTVHPDRFAHASSQEQLLAVQKSALINDAYETLKDEIKLGEYLLTLRQVNMPSNQASYGDTHFLMHQMELREMLEDIKFSKDIETAMSDAQQTLSLEYQQIFNEMQTQLNENSAASNNLACDNLRKLKFYQKLNIEVERLEDALFDD